MSKRTRTRHENDEQMTHQNEKKHSYQSILGGGVATAILVNIFYASNTTAHIAYNYYYYYLPVTATAETSIRLN